MLNNKSILVTGGTGSFGSAYVKSILTKYPKIKRLVIFSRDELKQYEMQKILSPSKHKCLRFFLGDIRDEPRLQIALQDIDIVVHRYCLHICITCVMKLPPVIPLWILFCFNRPGASVGRPHFAHLQLEL